jgi:hypothetical protein
MLVACCVAHEADAGIEAHKALCDNSKRQEVMLVLTREVAAHAPCRAEGRWCARPPWALPV